MKLFIDGNILLDVLQKREPHYGDSSVIWKLCETGKDTGYVSSLSFCNLVYVMLRELTPAEIGDVLKKLSHFSFCGSEAFRSGKSCRKEVERL